MKTKDKTTMQAPQGCGLQCCLQNALFPIAPIAPYCPLGLLTACKRHNDAASSANLCQHRSLL